MRNEAITYISCFSWWLHGLFCLGSTILGCKFNYGRSLSFFDHIGSKFVGYCAFISFPFQFFSYIDFIFFFSSNLSSRRIAAPENAPEDLPRKSQFACGIDWLSFQYLIFSYFCCSTNVYSISQRMQKWKSKSIFVYIKKFMMVLFIYFEWRLSLSI